MIFLPIVGRELQSAARLKGTYWLRFAAALLALIVSGVIMIGMHRQPLYETGRIIFIALSWLVFLVCLFSGLWLTCDCLSEEKRGGTLGLLFLTDLRGYDVVIGKLAANSVNALFSVLAVVPILGLTLLMGGLTLAEIARTALVLLTTLLFSLSCGLLASAVCHSSRRAMSLTIFLLLGMTVMFPLVGVLCEDYLDITQSRIIAAVFYILSPGCALVYAETSQYGGAWIPYWGSIAAGQVFAWLYLLLACLIVPRTWQEKSGNIREGSLRAVWHRFRMGGTGWRRKIRVKKLAKNPYYWLASRERWRPYLVWGIFVITAGFWAWGWYEERGLWFTTSTYATTALIVGAVIKTWVCGEACRRFGADRRLNALELMLTSPLTVRQILAGQWLALSRMFLWPTLFYLAAIGVFMALEWRESKAFWMWPAFLVVFLADWVALGWLSMWLSLRLARPHRAMILTSLLILPVPWLLFGVAAIIVSLLSEWIRAFRGNDMFYVFLAIWAAISLAMDLLLGGWAWYCLNGHFRAVAATPVGMWPDYSKPSVPRQRGTEVTRPPVL